MKWDHFPVFGIKRASCNLQSRAMRRAYLPSLRTHQIETEHLSYLSGRPSPDFLAGEKPELTMVSVPRVLSRPSALIACVTVRRKSVHFGGFAYGNAHFETWTFRTSRAGQTSWGIIVKIGVAYTSQPPSSPPRLLKNKARSQRLREPPLY